MLKNRIYYNHKNINAEVVVIILMIFFSIGIRFYFADFSKHFFVYYDELRYLSLAESIAHGQGLKIWNLESGYQKILYSLFIAPAYLISNRVITIRVITLINVLLMTLGVIPVYLLSKKYLLSPILRVLVCMLYLLGSDMTYSMTFMSEILYIPMAIWLIYLLINLFEHENNKQKILYSVLIGFYIYLMYLTKEIALIFLIAVPAFNVMEYGYSRISNDWPRKKGFINIAFESIGVILSFLLCHLILKNTLFAGYGNSYNQMGINILLQDGRIRYLLYGFVYYICSCLVAFGVLPVLIPLVKFKCLSKSEKKLYMLLCILAIGTACVVAYTITVREDFGTAYEATPSAHLRYISYVIWPLLILLLSLSQKKEKILSFFTVKSIFLVGTFGIIFIMFWRGIFDGSSVDQTVLTYLLDLSENGLLVFTCCLVAGTVISIAFFDKRKKLIISLFLIFLGGTCLVSNVKKMQSYYNSYSMTIEEYADVKELDAFIVQHTDDNFIMVSNQLSDDRRLIDTYINHDNMYTVGWDQVDNEQQENGGKVSIDKLECRYNGVTYGIQIANYLVFEKDDYITLLEPEKYKEVLSNEHYIIYDINRAEYLPLLRDVSVLVNGENVYTPNAYWPFSSLDSGRNVSTGTNVLMFGPYITLPSGTYSFEIYYSYVGEPINSDTVVGYCDIYSDAVNWNWEQYATDALASSDVVCIDNVTFEMDIPRFELRMMAEVAGVKIEKVIIHKH